ncbi:MAG: pilus assembly protein PilP [bacterium]
MNVIHNNRNLILMQAAIYLWMPWRLEASNIDKPAGALPVPKIEQTLPASNLGLSKSKLVPLKRRMDLASGAAVKATRAKPKPAKISVVAKTTKFASVPEPAVNADAAAKVSASDGDQAVWDSANKRYDDQDPSNTASKRLRVEDIIEPTIDYRYSSARRKNPFVPEIVLTGQIARQRELSPNDVEIPIVSPLQAFALSQLSVIGVWETDAHLWKALIGTPATQGIEAKLGDPVGNSGGRIMSINPESVIVREFSVRFDGTREYRDVPLHMGSDLPVEKNALEKVGGRLILRPGASQPEVVAPDQQKNSNNDSLISNTAVVVPGSSPGTLKTIERVMDPQVDTAVSERKSSIAKTIDEIKKDGSNPEIGVLPQESQTPLSGGMK